MARSALRMLSLFVIAAGMTCSLSPLAAQSSTPPAVPAAPAPPTYKLSVQVKRVIVDVVVTDASGKPVDGLKQDDFKVFEDGALQPLRSFDAHTASAGPGQPPVDLHLPPNTFSNLTLASPDKPVTILLYDALNTPSDSMHFAHTQLVKFIKDQKSSTRVAIFVLTDRLHMLQGFTDDETRLMAAIDDKALASHTTQLRVADTGADAAALLADAPVPSTVPAGTTIEATPEDEALQMLQFAEAEEQDFETLDRIQITAQAFINVARFAASIPGRKNLVWMAGAFPVEIWPGRGVSSVSGSPTGGAASAPGSNSSSTSAPSTNIVSPLDNLLREAQAILKDSRVAIYPVDIRGLRADTAYRADSAPPPPPPTGTRSRGAPPRAVTFGEQDNGEHAIMDAIAESSGGRAFYNTNGITEAMDAAVREGSEYYSLTYAPSNGKEDGGERRVKVVLSNPRYRLSYRERYLAPDAAHPVPVRPLAQDLNMQHGAPDSSELFFEAKVFPVGGAMPPSAAEEAALKPFVERNARNQRINRNKPAQVPAGPTTIQHYGINLAMIGRELEMPPAANGRYASNLSFGLAAYTQDGELLNGTEIDVKNTIAEAQYRKIQTEGYQASMVFAAPTDATSLRIGVRDEIGHRIGTIEIALPVRAAANNTTPAAASK